MRNEMDFCTFLAYWLEFSVSQATMNLSRNLVPVKSYYAVPWDICHVGRDVNTGFWLSPGEIGCKETEPQTSWCFGFFFLLMLVCKNTPTTSWAVQNLEKWDKLELETVCLQSKRCSSELQLTCARFLQHVGECTFFLNDRRVPEGKKVTE